MSLMQPRRNSVGLAVLIVGLIICIPFFIIFIGNELFMYIKSQSYGYIYMFKIEYFPYWSEECMIVGFSSLLLLTLAGSSSRVWLVRVALLAIFVAWSVIENTSTGTIEQEGLFFRSPSTYYDTQKIAWKEANKVTLKIVDRSYGRSNITTYGIIDVKANNVLLEIPFSFRKKDEREKLIEVLQFLQQNDIQVKCTTQPDQRFRNISKELLDILRAHTVQTE